MPSEKIYYGVLIFLCIASMLLSTVFLCGCFEAQEGGIAEGRAVETHLIVQCRGGGGFVLDMVEMVLTDIAQNRANGIRTNKEFGKKFVKSTD